MIAATYTQGGNFKIEEVPVPEIADAETLVKVGASSICATDLKIIRNEHRKLRPGQKIILGHEFVGVIEKSGPKANTYPIGTRVGVAPNIGCGKCEECIRGVTNMCASYSAFGIDMNGAHTQYVRIPHSAIVQGNIIPLPDSISFIEATLLEPLSCVVNGIEALKIRLGDTVVILGAGPIGLMHLLVASVAGAGKVMVVDIIDSKLEKAMELGACSVINSAKENVKDRVMQETKGRGADVVITACPSGEVQEQSLELLAPFGRVCFFGSLPGNNPIIRINSNLIHYKNLMVTGVTGGSPYNYRQALNLVENKRISILKTVSDIFKIADMEEAFELALKGNTLKIVLENS